MESLYDAIIVYISLFFYLFLIYNYVHCKVKDILL